MYYEGNSMQGAQQRPLSSFLRASFAYKSCEVLSRHRGYVICSRILENASVSLSPACPTHRKYLGRGCFGIGMSMVGPLSYQAVLV